MKSLYEYFGSENQEELFHKLINEDPSVSELNQYFNNVLDNRLHANSFQSQLSVTSYFKRRNCKPSPKHYYILTANTKNAPIGLYAINEGTEIKEVFNSLYSGRELHSGLVIYHHESHDLYEFADFLRLTGDRVIDQLELKENGNIYSVEHHSDAGHDRNHYEELFTPHSTILNENEIINFKNGITKFKIPEYRGDWREYNFAHQDNIFENHFNFLEDMESFQSFKNYFVKENLKGLHIEKNESQIQDLLKIDIQDKERETFNIFTFDHKYRVNDYQNITIGGINTTIAEPKALMKHILNADNKGFAVVHNHPSNIPSPSEADISITDRLHQIAENLDTLFYEHYIVGKGGVLRISQYQDMMLTYDKRNIQDEASKHLEKEKKSNERSL